MSRIDLHLFVEDRQLGDALQAIAFISGTTIEEAALDALSAVRNILTEHGTLLPWCVSLAETVGVPAEAVAERLREYRDLNGIKYPDDLIARQLATECNT